MTTCENSAQEYTASQLGMNGKDIVKLLLVVRSVWSNMEVTRINTRTKHAYGARTLWKHKSNILKQCAEFKDITQNITYETYFDDDTNMTMKNNENPK